MGDGMEGSCTCTIMYTTIAIYGMVGSPNNQYLDQKLTSSKCDYDAWPEL